MSGRPKNQPSVSEYVADKEADEAEAAAADEIEAALRDEAEAEINAALSTPPAPPAPAGPPPGTVIGVNPKYKQKYQAPAYVPGGEGDPNRDGLGAFLRSAAQGATARWGDELSGELADYLLNEHRNLEGAMDPNKREANAIPRTYGTPTPSVTDEMRAELATDRAAYAKAPFWQDPMVLGEATGGAALALAAPASGAARGATMVSRIPGAAKVGALWGGAVGTGGADGDLADRARGGLEGATAGLVLGPVADETVGAVSGRMSEAARAASEALRRKANVNRVAATGTYGAQMRNTAQNKGEQWIQDLGEGIEAKGLHEGEGPLGFLPQPPETYGRNAQALRSDALERMTSAEDAIVSQADPLVPTASMIDDMRGQSGAAFDRVDPAGQSHGGFMSTMADRMENASQYIVGPDGGPMPGTQAMPFSRAIDERRYLDSNIDWTRRGGYEGSGMQEQVRRGMAGDMRAGIRETIDKAAESGQVDPAVAANWKGGMQDYALAAAVEEPAMARVYQEYGNQKISLPGWLGANAVGGPLAPLGVAAGEVAKHRGAAALAGTQRLGQRAFRNVADAAEQTAMPASMGAARAAQTATAPAMQPAYALDGTDDPEYGPMLSQLDRDERATQFYVLMSTDDEFRARQRERGQQKANE